MGNLVDARAAALKAAQDLVDLAKSEDRDLTSEESATVSAKMDEVDTLDRKADEANEAKAIRSRLAGYEPAPLSGDEEQQSTKQPTGGIGDRFLKSDGMQALRSQYGASVKDTKNPIYVEARGVAELSDLGIGRKGLTTESGQVGPTRLPGYYSEILDEQSSFLSLITTGSTDSSWLEYAQIVSTVNNAAIVPEGELKPLSDVTTAKAEAKAHVYADGFEVTNQTLADDGALVAFMQNQISKNVRNVVEDVVINGDDEANIKGVLNTTGVQSQDYDSDIFTTLARALAKVEAVNAVPQAIVMNPSDAWVLKLQRNGNGDFIGGGPFSSVAGQPWGVSLVTSTRITAGQALVGSFKSLQLLQREALSVVAFNQHKDFAQRNMSYVRAEMRALQVFYAPREVVVTNISGTETP